MVARITRFLLVLQALVATGITLLVVWLSDARDPWRAVAFGVLLVLAARMAITGNNFLLASRFRSELPADCRLGIWRGCQVFLSEFRATMLSSSWTMPFHSFSHFIPGKAEITPVLLIHGYGCNSGYWHSMSKVLQTAGIPHRAVNLEPVTAGIDSYVPQVHQALQQLRDESGHERAILVCHSMGGLVARAYLRVHGKQHVARVITLGTPHRGTALAHFGLGANTMEMRWTATEQEGLASEWLRQLAASEDSETYRLFVSIYSHHDNIISPQTSSHLCGAENIAVHGVGHVALALDAEIQALVVREILAASSAPASVGSEHA